MPELPEVQTTVNGLKEKVVGLSIRDVWTSYNSKYFHGSETIKDPKYFKHFEREVKGKKIISVERRAKNILINLAGGSTILVHMKMTGHLLYGRYKFVAKEKKDPWLPISPESLKDPYNRHVRLMFKLSNGHELALSDVRRFAKVTLVSTDLIHDSIHLMDVGPEPLDKSFTVERFKERLLLRPNGKIKQVLTDQTIIAGIGNIYADESLWRACIHPKQVVSRLPDKKIDALYKAIQQTLSHGINFGGDSTSDYRNINGEKGEFQEKHHAYQRTGSKCDKAGCRGKIERIMLSGRSTHFCPIHQKLQ